VKWYVPHLLSMREHTLWPPAADHSTVNRLLFLPTLERPVVVRVTEAAGVWHDYVVLAVEEPRSVRAHSK
jgi:hypothetical protein